MSISNRSRRTKSSHVEAVAGNGLLNRRALLGRGAVLAGAAGSEPALPPSGLELTVPRPAGPVDAAGLAAAIAAFHRGHERLCTFAQRTRRPPRYSAYDCDAENTSRQDRTLLRQNTKR